MPEKKSIFRNLLRLFNFGRYCREYKVGVWECPPVVFTIMGIVIISSILLTYFISRIYVDPLIVVLIVCGVTMMLLIFSYIILGSFERIAISSKEKSEFISIMSHQLRNPLSSIKWQLDPLLKNDLGITGESGKQALVAINEQNEKMVRMVNDLLEIGRIENNLMVLVKTEFSVIDLIKEIMAKYAKRVASLGIALTFSPSNSEISIYSDRSKIATIITHFLDNAICYSTDRRKIDIFLEKKEGEIKFTISDKGAGIPEKDKNKIFQKFFRGDESKKYKSDGLGIGLYLTKSIISLLKGKVGFSSIEGKGSTFWFILPIK